MAERWSIEAKRREGRPLWPTIATDLAHCLDGVALSGCEHAAQSRCAHRRLSQSGSAANVYFGPTCCRLTNTYRVPSKLKLSTCRHPAVATERRRLDSPCVTALSTLAKVIDRAVQGTRAIQPRRSAGRTLVCNGHGCEIQNGATANRFQRCAHRPFPLIG